MSNVLLEAVDLVKVYGDQNGDATVAALRGCDFTLHENNFIAVVGPSGAGKTTLIRLLSGVELPTSGTIFLRQLPIH
ncbi:MAG: ATP-binding cassette domain-containing protein, partial [Promethearchaeota archaeon]